MVLPLNTPLNEIPVSWSDRDGFDEIVLDDDRASDHTDEYLIVHFPRQRILRSGNLLFCRPGKPPEGRSSSLAARVRAHTLDFLPVHTTWPLNLEGVRNAVNSADFWSAPGLEP